MNLLEANLARAAQLPTVRRGLAAKTGEGERKILFNLSMAPDVVSCSVLMAKLEM